MQSTTSKQPLIPRTIARQRAIAGLALVAGLAIFAPAQPAAATVLGHGAAALIDISNDTLVTEVAARGGGARAGGARAGGARVGGARAGGARAARTTSVHRGGTTARRTTAVSRTGVARTGTAVRAGAWARPSNYYWRRGGAIAAGAAIGMVGAATAAAWAGPAPGPNMCWYYTDPSQRSGFWDYCK